MHPYLGWRWGAGTHAWASLGALWEHAHRRRVMHAMGRRLARFRALTGMVRRVPVARVVRPRHPFLLEALADRIEAHLHTARRG